MACTVDWLSEVELEAFLGVALDAGTAAYLIAAAQAAVRGYTDQCLTQVLDDVVFLDGTGKDAFRLSERPVTAVDQVQEDGVVTPPGTYPTHTWQFNAGGIVKKNDGTVWRNGRGNLKVTYDHGYTVDPLYGNFPRDLRLVTLSFARRVWTTLGTTDTSAGGALASESIGAYSYTLADIQATASATSFAKAEELILDRYRVAGPKSGAKR